jgi:(p)ppGpp synthase/HD superfamily hydrolase
VSSLARAVAIAADAHKDQVDKYGAPYILHPLRVMMRMGTEEAMMAAVLHDVVEDSAWTLEGLKAEGFSEAVLEAVDRLTKRGGESYEVFIERAMGSPLARLVKLADLEDNMDPKRIRELSERDWERLKKYHRAWEAIRCRNRADD